MQPYDQVIQKKLAIDKDCAVGLENLTGPTTAAPKMSRIVAGNMACRGTHRRVTQLQGEVNVRAFAPAPVNQPAAPKEHALRRHRQGPPIIIVLRQWIWAAPTQAEMNDVAQ